MILLKLCGVIAVFTLWGLYVRPLYAKKGTDRDACMDPEHRPD